MSIFLKSFNSNAEYIAYLKSNDYLVPNVSNTDENVYYGTTYAITVKYQFSTGGTAADDAVVYKKPGEQYSIVSPTIEGYIPNPQIVSGTTRKNLTTNVLYTPNPGPGPIPDIDDEPII